MVKFPAVDGARVSETLFPSYLLPDGSKIRVRGPGFECLPAGPDPAASSRWVWPNFGQDWR